MSIEADQASRANEICRAFPSYVKSYDINFNSKCTNQSNFGMDAIQFCATLGICPTQCSYCETRAATKYHQAWESTDNTNQFCQHQSAKYGTDFGFCVGRSEEFKTLDIEGQTSEAFCYEGGYPCSNVGGAGERSWDYNNALARCVERATAKSCVNGDVSRTYLTACSPITKLNSLFLVTPEKEKLCMADPCLYDDVCVCDSGWTIDEGGLCTVPIGGEGEGDDSLIARGSDTADLNYGDDLVSHIERARKIHMKAELAPVYDCDNHEWTYFTDSPVDGVTFYDVGVSSIHEYYAWAVRQNRDLVTFAFNLNTPQEGQVMDEYVTVAMGDMIVNPRNPDGTYDDLPIANEGGKLFGIKFDAANDNPDALGIYSMAKFHSVANTNNGFAMVSQYMHEIEQMSSTTNPTAAYVKFGGGIDATGQNGLSYLGDVPLNMMIPGRAKFEGSLDGDVEYYQHGDTQLPEQAADLITVRDDYRLLWDSVGGIGPFTRIFHFDREHLPGPMNYYRMHVAAECFNDVIGGIVKMCGVPSVTPTNSRTPTRSPTRSPSNEPSTTASATKSISRSPSSSMSPTPAPSFQTRSKECNCFDYGKEDYGINTLSLGDFKGNSGTQGRLVVCGNAELTHYSISSGLPPENRDDLVVGGDLRFTTGRVHGGNIVHGGTDPNDSEIGNVVIHGMMNGTIRWDPHRFNCEGADRYYKFYSQRMGEEPASGDTEVDKFGTVTFFRRGAQTIETYDVNCTDLVDIKRMVFTGTPFGQSVLVNFRGDTCDLSGFSVDSVDPQKVVFNFPTAKKITMRTAQIEANFLAPFAKVHAVGGTLRGKIIVGSWKGSMTQDYGLCQACLQKLNPWVTPAMNGEIEGDGTPTELGVKPRSPPLRVSGIGEAPGDYAEPLPQAAMEPIPGDKQFKAKAGLILPRLPGGEKPVQTMRAPPSIGSLPEQTIVLTDSSGRKQTFVLKLATGSDDFNAGPEYVEAGPAVPSPSSSISVSPTISISPPTDSIKTGMFVQPERHHQPHQLTKMVRKPDHKNDIKITDQADTVKTGIFENAPRHVGESHPVKTGFRDFHPMSNLMKDIQPKSDFINGLSDDEVNAAAAATSTVKTTVASSTEEAAFAAESGPADPKVLAAYADLKFTQEETSSTDDAGAATSKKVPHKAKQHWLHPAQTKPKYFYSL